MHRILLVFIFGFIFSFAIAHEEYGIVTAPLKMRTTPSLDGSIVTVLEKGAIVKIIEQTKNSITVENIESPWFKINFNNKTGWSFGGFISKDFYVIDPKLHIVTWSVTIPKQDGDIPYTRKIVLYNKTSKSESIIEVSHESAFFAFSQNLKYLVVDDGTDVIGTLSFYDVKSGKSIHSTSYSPRKFRWEGNIIKYNNIVCYDDGYTIFEQEIFNDGKIIRTGKYGVTRARG